MGGRVRCGRCGLGLLVGVALAASAGPAAAQIVPGPRFELHAASPPPPRPKAAEGLRGHVGIPVAARLLASETAADRLRGIERLGAIGTPEATTVLTEALEQSSPLARDPRARLTAVRALAPFAVRDPVRLALVREMSDAGADGRAGGSPLVGVARDTAALALARSGDRKALLALVNAVLQGGSAGEAAARALEAYPPESLAALLEGRKTLPPALVALLGRMGDLRALPRLRATLDEPDPAGKALAAVALAKLGDDTAAAQARSWLGRGDPLLAKAGAEVLAWLGAPDAPQAIAGLLASDATRLDGLELALARPSPALAKALDAALPTMPAYAASRAVAALGRAGGADAVKRLAALLGKPELAWAAAYALATEPSTAARDALERALEAARSSAGAARRLAVRAGIVRSLVLGDPPRGLAGALEAMRGAAGVDGAVATFGLAATGERSVAALLDACGRARCAAPLVAAIARGALARGPDALRPLGDVLAAEPSDAPSIAAVAAGAALLAMPDGGALPTSRLAAWAEGGGPLAPLAARALPSRDDDLARDRIDRLLDGSDPVIRAHVALGLARDPKPDAVSLLAGAYRFEEDAPVRRAIVRALSRRAEVQRIATLTLARDLDPDEGVRALARAALGGLVLDHVEPATEAGAPSRGGDAVAWIDLAPSGPEAAPASAARAARLVRADGLAVPVVADGDGALVVPGVPLGAASLALAPAPASGDADRR
jgi:HEAT repeat protein